MTQIEMNPPSDDAPDPPHATAQQLSSALAERAPFAMAALSGAEHRFISANPAFVALGDGRAVVGRTYVEVFPTLAAAHRGALDRAYQRGEPVTIDDVPLRLTRGGVARESCWRFSIVPIMVGRAEAGLGCYAVEMAWEVDGRLTEQEKDTFLSAASHELRTPLTTLKGLLQMAQRRLAAGQDLNKARTNVTMASQQVVRMEELLSRLFDISRLQAGELPLLIQRCNLSDLARTAALRAQAITDRHSIKVRGDEVALPIDADVEKIEQVLNNVLWNAVKFAPNGGEILVTIERRGGCAVARVCDRGVGIPAAEQPRLFDRFYRGTNTPAQHFGGLGIGLYLSSQIARRHGGRLWLEASSAAGSIFALELPLAEAAMSNE